MTFRSLDFVYVPTVGVDAAVRFYVETLGAELVFLIRAMDTTVANVRFTDEGPAILLSGHLHGERPVLIYRVDDYAATVAELQAGGARELVELEIPHGPCASFRAEGGQRYAVYELVRPEANEHFAGRIDPP